MAIEIVTARFDHIDKIAPLMRPSDVQEIWASDHQTPAQAVALSLFRSPNTRVLEYDDRPVCIFGCFPMDKIGIPWMLTTVYVNHPKVSVWFLRHTREHVAAMLENHERLDNWVDARNHDSIRWLKWAGFTIEDPAPYGADGLPFHHFYKVKNDV